MGKAIIKGNQGGGRYIVDIEFDTRMVDARKEVLNESVEKLETEEIPAAEQKTDEEFENLIEAETALNEYLEALMGDPDFKTITKLTTDAINQKIEYDLALGTENRLRARLLSHQKELEKLGREVKKLVQRPAWCIEYNEDLTGAVGTVEADYLIKMRSIDGEPEKDPILLPTAHNSGSDGMLQTIHSSGPASTFFNLAIYPGAQKHKPRYRLGTITALDKNNNTASVTLDVSTRDPDENSMAYVQDFRPVSFNNVLNHIPVEYMTCNANAFEVDDRVVVGFLGDDWEQARVIGFESDPRQCHNIYFASLDFMPTPLVGVGLRLHIYGMVFTAQSAINIDQIFSTGGRFQDFSSEDLPVRRNTISAETRWTGIFILDQNNRPIEIVSIIPEPYYGWTNAYRTNEIGQPDPDPLNRAIVIPAGSRFAICSANNHNAYFGYYEPADIIADVGETWLSSVMPTAKNHIAALVTTDGNIVEGVMPADIVTLSFLRFSSLESLHSAGGELWPLVAGVGFRSGSASEYPTGRITALDWPGNQYPENGAPFYDPNYPTISYPFAYDPNNVLALPCGYVNSFGTFAPCFWE